MTNGLGHKPDENPSSEIALREIITSYEHAAHVLNGVRKQLMEFAATAVAKLNEKLEQYGTAVELQDAKMVDATHLDLNFKLKRGDEQIAAQELLHTFFKEAAPGKPDDLDLKRVSVRSFLEAYDRALEHTNELVDLAMPVTDKANEDMKPSNCKIKFVDAKRYGPARAELRFRILSAPGPEEIEEELVRIFGSDAEDPTLVNAQDIEAGRGKSESGQLTVRMSVERLKRLCDKALGTNEFRDRAKDVVAGGEK